MPAQDKPLLVYSRRRADSRTVLVEGETDVPPYPPAHPQTPAVDFIRKLTRTPGGLLPVPRICKRRKEQAPPLCEDLRRSRQVAGLEAEKIKVCPIHLKKNVMRALDLEVDDGKEVRDQQLIDEYTKRFGQHLIPAHTRAMAALFGWTPT